MLTWCVEVTSTVAKLTLNKRVVNYGLLGGHHKLKGFGVNGRASRKVTPSVESHALET